MVNTYEVSTGAATLPVPITSQAGGSTVGRSFDELKAGGVAVLAVNDRQEHVE